MTRFKGRAYCLLLIELGDVATIEKGHKPLRQIGHRGELRCLHKQVVEQQPGLSIDLIPILAQIPSTATTRGRFPGQVCLRCFSPSSCARLSAAYSRPSPIELSALASNRCNVIGERQHASSTLRSCLERRTSLNSGSSRL